MKGPDRGYLMAITDVAEEWIRHCNGRAEGYAVSRINLRVTLAASTDVRTDEKGWISWSAGGNIFTAEPISPEPPPLPA